MLTVDLQAVLQWTCRQLPDVADEAREKAVAEFLPEKIEMRRVGGHLHADDPAVGELDHAAWRRSIASTWANGSSGPSRYAVRPASGRKASGRCTSSAVSPGVHPGTVTTGNNLSSRSR